MAKLFRLVNIILYNLSIEFAKQELYYKPLHGRFHGRETCVWVRGLAFCKSPGTSAASTKMPSRKVGGLRDEDLQIKAIATKAHCTADAEIWKGNCRLCEVQFKRYSDAKATARAFANPKYEGMLKVGPYGSGFRRGKL